MSRRQHPRFAPFRVASLIMTILTIAACGDDLGSEVRMEAPDAPSRALSTAGDNRYGVAVGGGTHTIAHTQTLGVGWVKVTARWHFLQPEGGALDANELAGLRAQVRAARENGRNVLVTLEGYPWWVHACRDSWSSYYGNPDCYLSDGSPNRHEMSKYPPDDAMYGALQHYMSEMQDVHFNTYPYDVQVWSVGNEFNATDHWFKTAFLPGSLTERRDPVAEYCKVVNYVSGTVRPRGGTLLAGEIAHEGFARAGFDKYHPESEPYAWLRELLRNCGNSFDIVGVHSYHSGEVLDDAMYKYRNVINYWGPGKPLWLSEVGTNHHVASNEWDQARHIASILTRQETPHLGTWDVTIYAWLDGPIRDYPNSWLVDSGTGAVRSHPYDCLRWFARDRQYGGARPAACYE